MNVNFSIFIHVSLYSKTSHLLCRYCTFTETCAANFCFVFPILDIGHSHSQYNLKMYIVKLANKTFTIQTLCERTISNIDVQQGRHHCTNLYLNVQSTILNQLCCHDTIQYVSLCMLKTQISTLTHYYYITFVFKYFV